VRERLLQRLKETKESNYTEAVREFLSSLPNVKTPLIYCSEMISVLLLNLAYASQKAGELISYRTLTNLTVSGEVGLGTLAGFSLRSLLSTQDEDPSLNDKMMRHTKEFQSYLSGLSEDSINRLTSFLQDALKVFDHQSSR
jgi:hypothetical protein